MEQRLLSLKTFVDEGLSVDRVIEIRFEVLKTTSVKWSLIVGLTSRIVSVFCKFYWWILYDFDLEVVFISEMRMKVFLVMLVAVDIARI